MPPPSRCGFVTRTAQMIRRVPGLVWSFPCGLSASISAKSRIRSDSSD